MPKKDPNSTPARVLNELFSQRLDTCEGKEKIPMYGGDYIRAKLLGIEDPKYKDCSCCLTPTWDMDVETCPSCGDEFCPVCWDYHQEADEVFTCSACNKEVKILGARQCWHCSKPICRDCDRDNYGHCGHPDAVKEVERWDEEDKKRPKTVPMTFDVPDEPKDALVKIIDVDPKSKAMAITFRGQPTASFVREPRAEVPFFTGEDDATENE